MFVRRFSRYFPTIVTTFALIEFLEDISPFCGATDTPIFGLLVMYALGFNVRVNPLLVCFDACKQWFRYLIFTSGATPVDLLVAGMVAEPF